MDFLQLQGRSILVLGVANRKSLAFHIGRVLEEAGADLWYSVRTKARREQLEKLLPRERLLVCDVADDGQIERLRSDLEQRGVRLAGMVHSIAFADYGEGMKPFHETNRGQFLQAVDVSCYSLIAVANALKDLYEPNASVVATSISTTRMASENYGFMAPIKAALDSALAFLTKSFSRFSRVRFNAVGPSLLKTSASAGIPGYVDAYLYAEQAIPRKQALQTTEAANVAAFLLSPRSSGIAGQTLVVDAGMSLNYFDAELIAKVVGGSEEPT